MKRRQSERLPKNQNGFLLSAGSPQDVRKGIGFWVLGYTIVQTVVVHLAGWSRIYKTLVFYLYTLRVGPSPTNTLCSDCNGSAENSNRPGEGQCENAPDGAFRGSGNTMSLNSAQDRTSPYPYLVNLRRVPG